MIRRPGIIDDVNTLAAFLAQEELRDLSSSELLRAGAPEKADVIVLLANAVLHTAERAFEAMRRGVARNLVISGGVGHSTAAIRNAVSRHPRYRDHSVAGRPEAEILAAMAVETWGLDPRTVLVESHSTNCGENAAFTRTLLEKAGLRPVFVILVQDPTMQRRTVASFQKAHRADPDMRLLSCPTFVPMIALSDGVVKFANIIEGAFWPLERFLSLILGEIPRLRDTENGYGPRGRAFIPHVEIPPEVEESWARLARSPEVVSLGLSTR